MVLSNWGIWLMSLTITHPFVSLVADGGNTSLVQPSNWNASHTILGDSTATSGYVLVGQGSGVAPVWAAPSSLSLLVVGTTTITGGATTRILYDNAGVLGEYTITGSGTVVAMQTSPRFITDIAPTANDGAAIGTTLLSWSDLFLASGGVINWNAGTITLTQSSNTLTLSGSTLGSLVLSIAGTQDSSSSSNGTLRLSGGLGCAGSIYIASSKVYGLGALAAIRYGDAGGGSGNWFFGNSGTSSASLTGGSNLAFGNSTMTSITGSAVGNIGIGSSCNNNLTSGQYNTSIGDTALYSVAANLYNIAIGAAAGYPIGTGADANIFIGFWAGRYNSAGTLDTSITGDSNIIIGSWAQIPSATTSAQLNIGGLILGTGLSTSTTGALSTASSATARIVGSLTLDASLSRVAPVTETGASHTVATTTTHLICNRAGTITVTLPTASSFPGREIYIKTITANTVVSASSNVDPSTGSGAGTAILPATDGAWALLVSDGTNWIIMAANPLV